MSQERKPSRRMGNITVDSDWATTIALGLIFVVFCLVLVWDVRGSIAGDFTEPTHVKMNYWSISGNILKGVAAIFIFVLAFTFTQRLAKIACVLMGTKGGAFALLGCFDVSSSTRRIAAVCGSIFSQIALVIFLVLIAQWFKSVVRRNGRPELQAGDN